MNNLIFNYFYHYPLRNISNSKRYGNTYMTQVESVPDHVSDMNVLALRLNQLLATNYPELLKKLVDLGYSIREIIWRNSIHDLDEAVSQDISREIKYYDKRILGEIERVSIELLASSGTDPELIKEIKSSKNVKDINGFITKFLDIFQSKLLISREYQFRGNKEFFVKYEENKGHVKGYIETTLSESELPKEFLELLRTLLVSEAEFRASNP